MINIIVQLIDSAQVKPAGLCWTAASSLYQEKVEGQKH